MLRLPRALAAHPDYTLDLGLVALASLLFRLPWVIIVKHGVVWDSTFYYYAAKSIAAGNGYSILGHATAFFPVGWPGFLGIAFAITGPSLWTIMVLNLILWSITAALAYLLGRRLGGRAAGIVAGLIIAVSPEMTLYVLRAYSEALFIPLLLGACLFLVWRRETPTLRMASLAGICLGLAILVRSTAIPLPFLLPLWLLVRNPWRESWRSAVALCLVSCAVVSPWLIRNAIVMHSPLLSTNGGYTLWIGNHLPPQPGQRRPHSWAIDSVHAEVSQNSELTRASFSFMVHHTGTWLGRVPHKFEALMGWNDSPITNALRFQYQPDPRGRLTYHDPATLTGAEGTLIRGALDNTWIFRAWHYAFWILGGLAMLLALWRRKPAAGLVLLLVGFWILFHSFFFFGDVRFMISVAPLVAAPLAWMLVETAASAKKGLALLR
ncbi:MAG TPA: glycosyltransferase family 39 protein [Gaiellaceae bacterium]|nr:glycosyltransferase family 39 protein [Gaiellaceae bacterium]